MMMYSLHIGPQCVLSCAKEHRPLPKQGFTCCLAMDGVKLLTSGFEMDERVLYVIDVNMSIDSVARIGLRDAYTPSCNRMLAKLL